MGDWLRAPPTRVRATQGSGVVPQCRQFGVGHAASAAVVGFAGAVARCPSCEHPPTLQGTIRRQWATNGRCLRQRLLPLLVLATSPLHHTCKATAILTFLVLCGGGEASKEQHYATIPVFQLFGTDVFGLLCALYFWGVMHFVAMHT